jgi:hypothetical protein
LSGLSLLREATLESGRRTGLLFTIEGMPWDREMLGSIMEVEELTDGGVKPTTEAGTADGLVGSWLTCVSVADALDEAGTADIPEIWL